MNEDPGAANRAARHNWQLKAQASPAQMAAALVQRICMDSNVVAVLSAVPDADLQTTTADSGHPQTFAPLHTLKGQALRDGCLLDSGHGLEPLNHGFIESGGTVRRPVCRRWKIGGHRNYVVDSDAGIDFLKCSQALEKELPPAKSAAPKPEDSPPTTPPPPPPLHPPS